MKTATAPKTREQRGLELFLSLGHRIATDGHFYFVPGSGGEDYQVTVGHGESCTCEDRLRRQAKCKHIHAAELFAAAFVSDEEVRQAEEEHDAREWAEAVKISERWVA